MSFDFRNYQPFSKYHARKVKFLRFTCIKIGNERFAAKNCDYFLIQNVSETKNISLTSIQSAEFDEFEIFRPIRPHCATCDSILDTFVWFYTMKTDFTSRQIFVFKYPSSPKNQKLKRRQIMREVSRRGT